FVETVLLEGLGVQELVVGEVFRFGFERVGDFDFLQQACSSYGFTVEAAQTVEIDRIRVSSTKVRKALAASDFALAERML
ncbi:bifunctional riboflavin kinase/FAD synthetase, partial [Pseudomonas syringae pv. tagetis]